MQSPLGGTGVAPGWYPDPTGRHQQRYWDGASWTQHVADAGGQGTDPLDTKKAPRRRRGMALIVVGGLLGLLGAAVAVSAATMRQPVVPAGTPSQVLSLPAMDGPGDLTSGGLIAYQVDPYGFDVTFSEKDVDPASTDTGTPFLQSIDGDWYGKNGYVSVDGEDRGTATPDTTEKGWGDSLPDHAERVVSPTLHVSLPIKAGDVGKTVTVAAGMRVILPFKYSSGFSEAGAGVERSAKFFVVSPAQMDLRQSLDNWKDRSNLLRGGLMFLGIGAVLFAWGLVRRRKGAKASVPRTT